VAISLLVDHGDADFRKHTFPRRSVVVKQRGPEPRATSDHRAAPSEGRPEIDLDAGDELSERLARIKRLTAEFIRARSGSATSGRLADLIASELDAAPRQAQRIRKK
jgi:hypothetical protein